MTAWWSALILLCYILNCVETAPSPVAQKTKYNESFCLTYRTRQQVQRLLKEYKKLGIKNYDYRDLQLKDLPSLSTDFYSWLQLTDMERLRAAFYDIQVFSNMLEWKRGQLEKERMAPNVIHISITRKIKYIQLDLRDLMKHVKSQLGYNERSWKKSTSPTVQTHLNTETNSTPVWDSLVDGYIILRDLDLYLTKLARDFLLLDSKTELKKINRC